MCPHAAVYVAPSYSCESSSSSHLLALAAADLILGGEGGGNTLDGLYSRRAWAVNEVLALRAINPSFALVPASAGMLTYADVC